MFLLQYKRCNTNTFVLRVQFYKSLWLKLNRHFHSDLKFSVLTPQTVILSIFNYSVSNIHLTNYILFLFKLYIYKS